MWSRAEWVKGLRGLDLMAFDYSEPPPPPPPPMMITSHVSFLTQSKFNVFKVAASGRETTPRLNVYCSRLAN